MVKIDCTIIRARREELNITQAALAKLVGVTKGTISAIELGKIKYPRIDTWLGICKVLGISHDEK